jgi:hypothetical protein
MHDSIRSGADHLGIPVLPIDCGALRARVKDAARGRGGCPRLSLTPALRSRGLAAMARVEAVCQVSCWCQRPRRRGTPKAGGRSESGAVGRASISSTRTPLIDLGQASLHAYSTILLIQQRSGKWPPVSLPSAVTSRVHWVAATHTEVPAREPAP